VFAIEKNTPCGYVINNMQVNKRSLFN